MTKVIIELLLFMVSMGLIWVTLDVFGEGPHSHDNRTNEF